MHPLLWPLQQKLDKDTGTSVDITNYRGMIGSLLYLTASRPDIMYATCLCARFQVDPREPHLIVVKRIFKYLKGTADLGLWYPRESDFKLIGYSNAANFLKADWFLGLARNRSQFPHQLQKQNTLLQEAVVHRFFG